MKHPGMSPETNVENPEPTLDPRPTTHDPLNAPIYDCWNIIGVGGNASCAELRRYTHCRNCPVYTAGAAQLLDRAVTAEQRREWSEHYAREKKLTTPARTSVVIFRLGAEWLALPTPAFQEVAEGIERKAEGSRLKAEGLCPSAFSLEPSALPTGGRRGKTLHTLPHRRHGVVLGLVNIRGELLICVSLARLLGLDPGKAKGQRLKAEGQSPSAFSLQPSAFPSSRLLVTHWEGQRLVFPVDEVHGIQRIPQNELREPPATLAYGQGHTRALFAWREHKVGLLHAEQLFAALNRRLSHEEKDKGERQKAEAHSTLAFSLLPSAFSL
jgi:chemotaxis-related protein WspD